MANSSSVSAILDAAFQCQVSFLDVNPDVAATSWEISRAAAALLLEWGIGSDVAAAALLAPILRHDRNQAEVLAKSFDPGVVQLASEFATWHSARDHFSAEGFNLTAAVSARDLRTLFRQVYLDLPELNFIMLLIACHAARLERLPELTPGLAAVTQDVYVPLLGMLGLWKLRLKWIERTVKVLAPDQYLAMSQAMGTFWVRGNQEAEIRNVVEEYLRLNELGRRRNKRENRWLKHRRRFVEKELAFRNLAQDLLGRFDIAIFQVRPVIDLDRPNTGQSVLNLWDGQSQHELEGRIRVRIVCETEQDCYRALGLVHHLGKPVAPRFSQRFFDFIASPQENSYQALHTAIVYKHVDQQGTPLSSRSEYLVQIRIMTKSMKKLNDWGFIAHKQGAQSEIGWWTRKSHRLQRLLEKYDLDTTSDPICVFTPRGEIKLLAVRSTALDFAYGIHSEVGHHAASISVNGQSVAHDYVLRNWDLVKVHNDPQYTGPDLSWLNMVTNPRARSTIRQRLADQARAVHPGRAEIEGLIIKLQHYFETKKKYRFTITTSRLDAFLQKYTTQHGYKMVSNLYDAVMRQEIAPSLLAHRLIGSEFAAALVNTDGRPLTYASHQISFCDKCQVVPGEQIVAFERRTGRRTKKLVIHKIGNDHLSVKKSRTPEIPIHWANDPESRAEIGVFQIMTEARRQLVGDILNVIYAEPDTELLTIDARSRGDGTADIALHVGASRPAQLVSLRSSIEQIPSIRGVQVIPASGHQRRAAGVPRSSNPANPYSERVVFDRLDFFDREEVVANIVDWLHDERSGQWIILHGHRRVGKTSVARYLMHEVLSQQRLVFPVFLDMQAMGLPFDEIRFANLIIAKIYQILKRDQPARKTGEPVVLWFNRLLDEAREYTSGLPFLLIVDEFSILLEDHDYEVDPQIFRMLRSSMSRPSADKWLFIVQDSHFLNPSSWGAAESLMSQASQSIALQHLDSEWANRLIVEPGRRLGIHFAEPITEEIWRLSNGNPYLIKLICFQLVERVRRQKRTNVTNNDLDEEVSIILYNGDRWFHHFDENLDGVRRLLICALSKRCEIGGSTSLQDTLNALRRKAPHLIQSELNEAVDWLVGQELLHIDNKGAVSIPICLFHRWIKLTCSRDTGLHQ